MKNKRGLTIGAAIVLGAALVCAAYALSKLRVRYGREQTAETIKVKGYAEMPTVADKGKFDATLVFEGRTMDGTAHPAQQLFQDILNAIRDGAPEDLKLDISAPSIEKVYRKDAKGHVTNEVEKYRMSQSVTVYSGDVQWIKKANVSLGAFISRGYDIRIGKPSYIVGNLSDLKLKLLKKATANGFERAKILAGGSGATVGELCSARQGVFQITAPNSTSTSDWGCYDTSTIEKTAKIVVTLEYKVVTPK